MNEGKVIIFITASLSQPRIIKRITSISEAGFKVKVYGYSRGVYDCNKLPSTIEVIKLGHQRDGQNYLNKFIQIKKDLEMIIKKEKNKKDVIYYSFSFLISFFLLRLGVKYIYEISDILYGYKKFLLFRPLLKKLDRNLVKKSVFTVVTSEGFIKYLFGNNQLENVVVQPNKLNSYFKNIKRDVLGGESIGLNYAFIGAIRYPKTILRFAKIIGEYYPFNQFHFYGDSVFVNEFKNETAEYQNVKFFGKYKNPEDLEKIYSNVDVVVSCYETESLNERIAEPNKLYEAMFFCKPIIVSKNSFLEKQIKKYNCGYAINAYSNKEIRMIIDLLDREKISNISRLEYSIDSEILIDNPSKIIEKLQTI